MPVTNLTMPVTTFSRNAREILKGPRDIFGKNARENFSLARGNFRKTARETSKVPVAKIEKTCVTGKMGVTGKQNTGTVGYGKLVHFSKKQSSF